MTDELTGLANRRALERALDARHDACERGTSGDGALALLDIDGLKAINDARGHDVGDALAAERSERRSPSSSPDRRRSGTAATNSSCCSESALEAMQARAARRGGRTLRSRTCGFETIDASFGVASFAEVGGSPREALRLADSRMYAMKVSRR